MFIHCFLWLGNTCSLPASLALTEHLGSAIQQLPALPSTGDSGELWGLPPVLGITAIP